MDKLIDKYEVELSDPACGAGGSRYGILVRLPNDISKVYPYLNAVSKASRYDHENGFLLLDEPDERYAFRPTEIRLSQADNIADARAKAEKIVDRLNKLWQERDSIKPDVTERSAPPVMVLFKMLPGTNCGRCGQKACMAFAAALSRGEVSPDACVPMQSPEFAGRLERLNELCPPSAS